MAHLSSQRLTSHWVLDRLNVVLVRSDQLTGHCTGVGDGDRLGARIERTINGGHTWESVTLPVPPALRGDDLGVGTPTFFNADDGVVDVVPETSGNTRRDRVLVDVTHDGGSSWTTAPSPAGPDLASYGSPPGSGPGQAQLVPFSVVSMKTWVFLLGPVLSETTNGGATWTKVTPDPWTRDQGHVRHRKLGVGFRW